MVDVAEFVEILTMAQEKTKPGVNMQPEPFPAIILKGRRYLLPLTLQQTTEASSNSVYVQTIIHLDLLQVIQQE